METQVEYYQLGNAAYVAHDYDKALDFYSQGLTVARGCQPELTLKLLLNRSQCAMQLRHYERAIQDCSSVLNIDPHNVKALFRRASAYEYSDAVSKALSDITAFINFPSSLQGSYLNFALKEKERLNHILKKDKIVMQREGRPVGMVTKEQVIRLFIFEPPPPNILVDETFLIRICAGNEFGLWDRDILAPSSASSTPVNDIYGQCELIIPGFAINLVPNSILENIKLNVISQSTRSSVIIFNQDGKMDLLCKINLDTVDTSPNSSSSSIRKTRSRVPVLIKISLTTPLPSGAVVMPVITLPILVILDLPDVPIESNRCELSLVTADSMTNLNDPFEELVSIGSALSPNCIRLATMGPQTVMALECPGLLGIGGKVWDSTFVLLEYLNKNSHLIRGKRIVELGSGTGLAGIGLSTLQPQSAILTDMIDVVPLLQANIKLNSCMNASLDVRHLLSCDYSAEELFWGTQPSEHILHCNSIVASDVVYDPIGYDPLIQSIVTILSTQNNNNNNNNNDESVDPSSRSKLCILAHRHRHPEDAKFFAGLRSQPGLVIDQIPFSREIAAVSKDLVDVEIYHISYCNIDK